MTDSKQKQDFSARIQRIQEKHGGTSQAHQTQPDDPMPRPKGQGARNAAIWMVLIVAAGAGGFFALKELKNFRSQLQLTSTTDAPVPVAEAKQPEIARQITDQGWVIPSPGVATVDLRELTVSDIADGFDATIQPGAPQSLKPFLVNDTCTFRKPRSDEVVYNVRMETGTLPTTTHVFSNEAIAHALEDHVEAVTSSSKAYLLDSRARGRMFAVDVFVTDTSAPVYLVLQSFRQNVIWNLQLAQGVTVAHVAMIGENSGLAVPETDVSFEAIRISDFVTNFEFGANDEPQPCMVAPWREPQPHWPAQVYANDGNDLYKNQIYSFNTGYRAFGDWYEPTMGVSAATNVIAPHSAAHVLVGEVPEQRIQYAGLAGRDAYVSQNDFAVIGDDAFENAHHALLAAAVGGDPGLLDPAPQERAEQ